MAIAVQRASWLVRRLSRMYPAEIPYRLGTIVRVFLQSQGFRDARRIPTPLDEASYGKPWSADVWSAQEPAVLAAARRLLDGELQVLGHAVPLLGGAPEWNRDPVTGTAMPLGFGLLIDPRHLGDRIDIKHLWEVNRHLWWVTLAQGYSLTGDGAYVDRLAMLIDSWTTSCPYPLGPNWTSPVEHGIRLINWSLAWHLMGGEKSPAFQGSAGASRRDRWLSSIYQHVRFARDNYSFYSSADNHLIGEAAGVFVAARTWDLWAEVRQMGAEAKSILEQEAVRQFSADGVNREQAFCYHKFALQFLVAAGLCGRANGDDFSPDYWGRVESGLVFLASMMDCAGRVPPVGDGDDSDVFRLGHEPGSASYAALLALGARLFPDSVLGGKRAALVPSATHWAHAASGRGGASLPTEFADGGYLLLGSDLHGPRELRVLFDIGPLGFNRVAGHGHADALSLVISQGGRDLLVDPGTYCYNSAPEMRRHFRGTAAHNTVLVDSRDQAEYGSSFLWLTDVSSTLRVRQDDGTRTVAEAAHDGYRRLPDPVTHCRRVTVNRAEWTVEVEDWLECRRDHSVHINWQFAPDIELEHSGGGPWRFATDGRRGSVEVTGPSMALAVIRGSRNPPQGWVSPRFGVLQQAAVLVASGRLGPGQRVRTVFKLARPG